MNLVVLKVLLIICLSCINSRSVEDKVSKKDLVKNDNQSDSTVVQHKDSFVTKGG